MEASKEELPETNEPESLFTIPFKPDVFGTTFQQSFKKLYDSTLLSDVILDLSNGEKIRGHKAIIASSSPHFKSIFEAEDLKECVLPFENSEEREYFKILLLYIYSGTVQVISSQVIPLIGLANKYGVTPLREACGDALGATLEPTNVFFLLDVAEKFHCATLRSACGKYLAENFGDLMEQDRLMSLDVATWVEMLKNDEIKVKSESDLLKYVVHYSKHLKDRSKEKEALEKMLPHIRFAFLPTKTLVEMESNPVFEGVKGLHDLLFEAYKFKAVPDKFKTPVRRRKFVDIFTWTPDPTITLSDDGCTFQKTGANGWNLKVIGSTEFESGNPSWEVTFDSINSDRSGMVVGIAPKDHPVASFDQCVGIGMSGGIYKTTTKSGTSLASGAKKVRVEVDFVSTTVNYYLDKVLYATGHFEWKSIVPTLFVHYAGDKVSVSFNQD